jgi:molybdate transport system substrate-binding protein
MHRSPITILVALFLAITPVSSAETITVAVAANFAPTLRQVSARFEADTGVSVRAMVGSTGKLYAQILHGAPVDVFLAADVERPQQIEEKGLAVLNTRFTYATGRLVLWSNVAELIEHGTIFDDPRFRRLAIANPKTAPYGRAAMEVLQYLGSFEGNSLQLLRGENVAQAHQFVYSGNADAGFVALSLLLRTPQDSKGSSWILPGTMHSPIRQQAVLLKRARDNAAAVRFIAFLKSAAVKKIIIADGYLAGE